MAQQKVGLDYFSFDVTLLADRKFRKLRLKHGYMAVMVYISILTLIYKDKGYYLNYNDPEDVHWDILDDLKGKFQPTAETVAEVIEDLVACELFSGDQFKSKILTSKRIQETYYRATVERKTVSIDSTIWELSLEEMQAISAKHSYYLFSSSEDNRPINQDNRPIMSDNRPINKQSKVKESKVNKSRVEESNTVFPTLAEVQAYCKDKAVNAERFYLHYQARGWKIGNTPITDWRALVDTWDMKDRQQKPQSTSSFDIDVLDQMLDIVPSIND